MKLKRDLAKGGVSFVFSLFPFFGKRNRDFYRVIVHSMSSRPPLDDNEPGAPIPTPSPPPIFPTLTQYLLHPAYHRNKDKWVEQRLNGTKPTGFAWYLHRYYYRREWDTSGREVQWIEQKTPHRVSTAFVRGDGKILGEIETKEDPWLKSYKPVTVPYWTPWTQHLKRLKDKDEGKEPQEVAVPPVGMGDVCCAEVRYGYLEGLTKEGVLYE